MIELLQANWPTIAVLAGVLAFFLLFRNRATRVSELDELLANGEPVIVEVFSNT